MSSYRSGFFEPGPGLERGGHERRDVRERRLLVEDRLAVGGRQVPVFAEGVHAHRWLPAVTLPALQLPPHVCPRQDAAFEVERAEALCAQCLHVLPAAVPDRAVGYHFMIFKLGLGRLEFVLAHSAPDHGHVLLRLGAHVHHHQPVVVAHVARQLLCGDLRRAGELGSELGEEPRYLRLAPRVLRLGAREGHRSADVGGALTTSPRACNARS
mmetsp:Transcript_25753/g.41208  ORF Transcript_25753/g.41208 Transcript_25753/m.41208 type:complete len:212 (-) Transcript_25753:153-788(-)